jgi:hypothetical protein
MKRTKRFAIRRVALGVAVAAVLVPSAQAKPIGSYERQSQSIAEIPYLSHGVGVSHVDFSKSSSQSRSSVEIPYLSHGSGVDEQLWSGSDVVIAPDDMALSRPTNAGSAVVAGGSGSFDVTPAAVSGFGIALVLLAGGSVLAIRHGRRTRLSPA